MIIHDCEQRSPRWYNLRCGKVTASNAHKLLTPAKYKTFLLELIAEQVTGELTQHFVSEAMQWGIDQEPFAIEWYANTTKFDVEQVGFIESETYYAGCSPDLVVGEKGMAQIKCPTSKNHVDYYMKGPTDEIITQMQFEMWIYEAEWNDFITFDPRWPFHMQGKIHRIERDEALIKRLEQKVQQITCEVDTFLFENNLHRKKLNTETSSEISKQSDKTFDEFIKEKAVYLGV